MRITIFDDDGNELAQASIHELKLDGRTRHVDIGATIMPMWETLPKGGASSRSVTMALMEYIATSGRAEISYSHPKDIVSVQAVGL